MKEDVGIVITNDYNIAANFEYVRICIKPKKSRNRMALATK